MARISSAEESSYLREVSREVRSMVEEGLLLPEGAERIIGEAKKARFLQDNPGK